MADGRSPDELGRAVDYIRDHYVTEKVFNAVVGALAEQVKELKQADTSEKAGNRNWLFGLAQTFIGVALGVAAAYLTTRGGK